MKRLLLLEDDPALNELFTRFLSDHQVLRASSVVGAMAHLDRNEALDAAIIDFWLVEGTAIPVLEVLRKNYPYVPVLVITGGNQSFSPELTEPFIALSRADLFLHKPFCREDLTRALKAVLRRKMLH